MSVSIKFLEKLPAVPEPVRPSIANFMAHVHQTVTDMSVVYKAGVLNLKY